MGRAWAAVWRWGRFQQPAANSSARSTAAAACKLRPSGRGSWCSSSPVHCPAELAAKAANLLHRQSKHWPPSSSAHLVGALGALHHQPRQLAGGVEGHVDQQLLISVRLEVQPIVLPVAAVRCKGCHAMQVANGRTHSRAHPPAAWWHPSQATGCRPLCGSSRPAGTCSAPHISLAANAGIRSHSGTRPHKAASPLRSTHPCFSAFCTMWSGFWFRHSTALQSMASFRSLAAMPAALAAAAAAAAPAARC